METLAENVRKIGKPHDLELNRVRFAKEPDGAAVEEVACRARRVVSVNRHRVSLEP